MQEFIYTSSEKSALTGRDGIGVRTYTQGMPATEVDALWRTLPGYDLDPGRRLDLEALERNPAVVYDYPAVYTFGSHQADTGQTLWIASRTVYIASDYGFFIDGAQYADRVGSNYITHALVFDTLPTPSLLAAMAQGTLFLPKDYTMRRDNPELRALLTGEPTLLPPRSIDTTRAQAQVSAQTAVVVKALLGAAVNRAKGLPDDKAKVMLKAPAAMTPAILRAMAAMPPEMMPHMRLLTNYAQGFGVPPQWDVVTIDEHNTRRLYEEIHITADLEADTVAGFDPNPIIDRAATLYAQGHTDQARALASYLLSLDHKTPGIDYAFMLSLYQAARTPAPTEPAAVTETLVRKLLTTPAPQADLQAAWAKINTGINDAFTRSENPAEILAAISATATLKSLAPDLMTLEQASRRRLTKMVMGIQSYLGHIVTPATLDTVLAIIDPGEIASEADFYRGLQQSAHTDTWRRFILLYYPDPAAQLPHILRQILTSPLTPPQREQLVAALFPAPAHSQRLYDFMLKDPRCVAMLPATFDALVQTARSEPFSALVNAAGTDPAPVRAMAPAARRYFDTRMADNPDLALRELLNMAAKIPSGAMATLALEPLLQDYVDYASVTPSAAVRANLDLLEATPGLMTPATRQALADLLALHRGATPSKVTIQTLQSADLLRLPTQPLSHLMAEYLNRQADPAPLLQWLKTAQSATPDLIGAAIWHLWQKYRANPAYAKMWIEQTLDCRPLDKTWLERYTSSCPDKDLAQTLSKSSSLTSRLGRKIKNIFGR